VAVAPAQEDDEQPLNTLRPAIMSVACWRLDDQRFDFDSSFILPGAATDFENLAVMHGDYADSPMSLFGHADPVGSDDYNKKLSGNRARAAYGVLTRDLDLWEKLYNEHDWGLKSTQLILQELERLEAEEAKADEADDDSSSDSAADADDADDADEEETGSFPVNGKDTPAFREAVKRFQQNAGADAGLKVDGIAGPNTRKELYRQYMDVLSSKPDGSPFQVEPSNFLGEGKDKQLKAAVQGCSEFNPVLILSDQLNKQIDEGPEPHVVRNSRNAPNRRVVMFFFPAGFKVDPAKWPCPTATAGSADCRKRFWSDSKTRLKPAAALTRTYGPIARDLDESDSELDAQTEVTQDTFACRFYDRLARRSPCEAGFNEWVVQLLFPGQKTKIEDRTRVAGIAFEAVTSSGAKTTGTSDPSGVVRIRARNKGDTVKLTLHVPHSSSDQAIVDDDPDQQANSDSGSGKTQGEKKKAAEAVVTLTLTDGTLPELIDGDPAERPQAVDSRLLNLGFGKLASPKQPRDPKAALDAYKAMEGADDSDPDAFDKQLRKVYGS